VSADQLVDALRDLGWSVTTAESCTGGLLAAAITEVAGASDVFQRGYVTYSNDAKHELLGVTLQEIEIFGAVSDEVAASMASGALSAARADISIAITGIAGPGGSEFKPEGRVCFGLAVMGQPTKAETVEFGALGRARVRAAARDHALELLLNAVRS